MKKAKAISFILAAALTMTSIPCIPVTAFSAASVNETTFVSGDCEDGELIIPETKDGATVTEVYLENENDVKTIKIPATVKKITIINCPNITSYEVAEDNPYLCSVDGVIYDKDMKTVLCYPPSKEEKEFIVPDTVETIGDWAFAYAKDLKKIDFPDGLVTIKERAFSDTEISSFNLPESLIEIFSYAFANNTSLTSITLPAGLKRIIDPFRGCSSLSEIVLLHEHPDEDNLSASGPDPDGDVYFQMFSQFGSIMSKDVNIYVSDNSYERYLQYYWGQECYLRLLSEYEKMHDDDPDAHEDVELTIRDGVLASVRMYRGTSVVVPDEVTTIGEGAFYHCTDMVSVTLPAGLKEIESYAFSQCTSLEELVIPDGVERLYFSVKDCPNLKKVVIPESVKEIWGFERCKNVIIYGESGSEAEVFAVKKNFPFVALDDADYSGPLVLFSDDGTELEKFPVNYEGETYTVPEGVKRIKRNAFLNCKIKKVILPESLEEIEDYAFYNAASLESVEFNEGLRVIGMSAFSGCDLRSVKLPESLKKIEEYAFEDNTELSEITIPENVSKLDSPFGGCLSLKEITIKRADKKAFSNLASSMELGDDETEYLGLFDTYMFDSCCNVYVPDYVFLEYENVYYSERNVLVLPESMRGHTILDGDVNGDNEVTVADAVMLQNYLLGKTKDILWYNGDIIDEYSDMFPGKFGQIDVFDLIELKKKLLKP
ncbi:MAG TPA: leucine-rich repeat protein [Ruminococcus flavefaciens]|nr:leucine-rich repeat protein [Ruminococcus flavefaciens]HQM00289.1 leucine-rich repeat protein [Ruminococcus flavefaciens]